MDEDDAPFQKSPPPSRPKADTVTSLLTELRHRWSSKMVGPDEWGAQLRAYLQDLSSQTPQLVMQAIRAGRKHWQYFPQVAEILAEVQRITNSNQGSGGMGALGWSRYKAWLQWTNRPCFRPYTDSEMSRWLAKIPDSEMERLGTPRHQASAAE